MLVEEYKNGSTIKCNVCPIINFHRNGQAEIEYPSDYEEQFNWEINENLVSILFAKPRNGSSMFENGASYQFNINVKKDIAFLEFNSIGNIEKIILARDI